MLIVRLGMGLWVLRRHWDTGQASGDLEEGILCHPDQRLEMGVYSTKSSLTACQGEATGRKSVENRTVSRIGASRSRNFFLALLYFPLMFSFHVERGPDHRWVVKDKEKERGVMQGRDLMALWLAYFDPSFISSFVALDHTEALPPSLFLPFLPPAADRKT